MDTFLTLGFFITGLIAIVVSGVMAWRLIGGLTRLVDQNARTMAAAGAIADKVSRQHDEVMSAMERLQQQYSDAMERLQQQHDDIVGAIVKLTEKIGMMADG